MPSQRCDLCLSNPQNMPHKSSGLCNRYRKEMELKETQNRIQQLQSTIAKHQH